MTFPKCVSLGSKPVVISLLLASVVPTTFAKDNVVYRASSAKPNSRAVTTASPKWTSLGPAPLISTTQGSNGDYGPITGRATAVVVDQNDTSGNTVYLGGASGGVWKSTNAANPNLAAISWTPLMDHQATTAVGSIAIQPGNSNLILVGTGETNSSSDSYYGLGILRSTDAGKTWTLIDSANNGKRSFRGLGFAKIAFSADNPNIVVAAVASASMGTINGLDQNPLPADCADLTKTWMCRGIYYSNDAGQTWTAATMVDSGVTKPDSGSVTSIHYNPQQHKFYAAFRNHGFYVSADAITWKRMGADDFVFKQPTTALSLTNCPSTIGAGNTCPLYRGEITQVPGRDEMYVWFVDSQVVPANGGIFQTKDGGKNWTAIDVAGIENCGDSSGCGTEQGDYNLALLAIPNGATATDLYAGAVNIYRCRINSANPTCATQRFVNLTHAYGCDPIGAFSKVHPNQHAFDFLGSNPNIIYFANDGGLYRTVDSLGLHDVPAACHTSTPTQPFFPFENLNGTMGSLTQFVSLSQHPTDQFTFLAGTHNGTVATDSGITWRKIVPGDGAFAEINPASTSEWFAANAGVSVQRCSDGAACTSAKFSTAVNSSRVKGDQSAFYMPYILDPQDPGKLIAGTCRVWRIDTATGASTQLSAKLDGTDDASSCSTAYNTMISALTTGGAKTEFGSQVIYAGTERGSIFVAKNAGSGVTAWIDVSHNPGLSNRGFPISSITVDPRDSTGNTVYATATGFDNQHVFRTSDGGATWENITGSLPNAPANALVLNQLDRSIYIATDVGVFSTTAPQGEGTIWTEVGPVGGSGALPNVAVTDLAIFYREEQLPLLRAATYGRGLWEYPIVENPTVDDYDISVPNPALLTYPGHEVTFSGTASAFGSYNSTVTIACDATSGPLPQTCSVNPASLNPSNTDSFSVTAENPSLGEFQFQIKGTGSDADSLVRTAPVQLRVIDFTLGTPEPSSVTDLVAGEQILVKLPVTSLGTFDQLVSINCDRSRLPNGWNCGNEELALSAGGSAEASVRISTNAATTLPGTYTVTMTATWTISEEVVRTQTQAVSIGVLTSSPFTLSASEFVPATVKVGQPFTSLITLTPQDGFAGSVNLSCQGTSSGIPPEACSFNPPSVSLSSGVGISTLTVSTADGSAGTGQIEIHASGGNVTKSHTLPFTLSDYTLSSLSQPNSISSGGTVNFSFVLTGSPAYEGTVAYACDTAQFTAPVTCVFSPGPPITLSSGSSRTINVSIAIPSNEPRGTYAITLNTRDQAFVRLQHSQSTPQFQITSLPDFGLAFANANSATISAGQSTSVALSVSAQGNFNSTVAFTISGCPSNTTCTVTPQSVTPTSASPATTTLNISTTAPSTAAQSISNRRYLATWLYLSAGAIAMALLRRKRLSSGVVLIFLLAIGMLACGGGGGGGGDAPPIIRPGTPAGTYAITVTGTGGTIVKSANFTLTVQ